MSRIPVPATIESAPAASQPMPAVRFAAKIVRQRGQVSEDDLRAVKTADYNDALVIEIVLHVGLNTLKDYVNEVATAEIDFPVVTAREAA